MKLSLTNSLFIILAIAHPSMVRADEPRKDVIAELVITRQLIPDFSQVTMELKQGKRQIKAAVTLHALKKANRYSGNFYPIFEALTGKPHDKPDNLRSVGGIVAAGRKSGWVVLSDHKKRRTPTIVVRTIRLCRADDKRDNGP